ncbi:Omega-hydroxypalmitate O-feruloyl transferase [Bienertia sinuspersici]
MSTHVSHEDFKVTTMANHVVTAAMPLQDHLLPLSNLDLLLPPLDVNVFFCYKNDAIIDLKCDENNISSFKYKVSVLKKALAQALAYFYPFAGEVVENSSGEPEILCNNRGVVFVEAFAEVELCELDLYHPDQSIEGKLVPKKKDAVFSIQLKCGGIVVACAFDHRVADAYSANMFWVTWAEMATSLPISSTPNFRRSLISPNNPNDPLNNNNAINNNDSFFDELYLPISSIPKPSPNQPQDVDPLVTRVYLISKDQLMEIQTLCSQDFDIKVEDGSCKRKSSSKLQSFSAFLWQIIASHA